MINKRQKHKSKNSKSTKNTKKPQKNTQKQKQKTQNKKQTKQVPIPKPNPYIILCTQRGCYNLKLLQSCCTDFVACYKVVVVVVEIQTAEC